MIPSCKAYPGSKYTLGHDKGNAFSRGLGTGTPLALLLGMATSLLQQAGSCLWSLMQLVRIHRKHKSDEQHGYSPCHAGTSA